MSNKKPVSIRTIAEICGVSPSTVSRVLNYSGRISDNTRNKVLNAIKEHNYSLAQNVRKVTSNKMTAILIPHIKNDYYSNLLYHLEVFFEKAGLSTIMMTHHNDEELEQKKLNLISELDVSGLVVIPAKRRITPQLASLKNIPMVFIDTDINDEKYYSVRSDHYIGGCLAAKELLRIGCKKPLILGNNNSSKLKNARIVGFIDTFDEKQIKIPQHHILIGNGIKGSFSESKDLIKYICLKGTSFDSIFANSDWKAFGALVALQELGYKIPEEIKIIGYDSSDIAKYTYIPITSIAQDISQIASTAGKMIIGQIGHEEQEQKHYVIPISLEAGKTT